MRAQLAVLCTVAAVARARTLVKTTLAAPAARAAAAYALDGSNFAFFTEADLSTNAARRDWVIYLEGGGECETHADCVARSRGALGSSDALDDTFNSNRGDYIISSKPADANPFADFGCAIFFVFVFFFFGPHLCPSAC